MSPFQEQRPEAAPAFEREPSTVARLRDLHTEQCVRAALKLHQYLVTAHWNGYGVVGPDSGVRFNRRIGRFIKSYLRFLPWRDSYYYLQAQGYWSLANWSLFQHTGEAGYREIALRCSEQMLDEQRRDGAWVYPNPEWKDRVATAECTWASLGLLATYRHTADERFLSGVLRWHDYLLSEVGFERSGDELAVNYFAKTRMARVPNNSAFVLRFLAELADVTGEKAYMRECAGMLAFMRRAQKPNGEFPYMVEGSIAGGRCWEHFQCYQYNAFQCLDLMRYYKITGNSALRPVLEDCLGFLRTGIAEDGHMFYDCRNRSRQVIYHAAVTGAAFAIAGRLGFYGYETLCDRVFSYLLRRQRPDGSFPYSQGDYYFLRDARSYPRNLSMILFHLVSENACTA